MPSLTVANPEFSVVLYKTISRETIDGQTAVSTRYKGKKDSIDLTNYLGLGSSIRTSKGVREPAGGFVIMFADKPQSELSATPGATLESIYGLVEPMDVVEIRMWGGVGKKPSELPIVMRGFISEVQRTQVMSDDGKPQRQVVVSGMDYGKLWQQYIILYLQAYVERKPMLTSYGLWELFGITAANTMAASEFVRQMIEKVINPYIEGFLPENKGIPRKIQTGDSISVKHGKVGNSPQGEQGSIYEILKKHGDVGVWNELYVEDRADGVHCVYRPVPAMHLTAPEGAKNRLIQDDATMPPEVVISDQLIPQITTARSDQNVGNFYWVNNTKYDLIDDMTRKLMSIPEGDKRSVLKDYPNAAAKYYGTRPMYAETLQSDDDITYEGSGLDADGHEKRNKKQESWIMNRLRIFSEMNKDNVVLERGSVRIKGGLMRPDGKELMKAGDYALFKMGNLPEWHAYVVQIDHEFSPFQSYTQNLIYERGEGFVKRTGREGGVQSPWLAEQATRLL